MATDYGVRKTCLSGGGNCAQRHGSYAANKGGCCCGDVTTSHCCNTTERFPCGWNTIASGGNGLACSISTDRIDIQMSGTATRDQRTAGGSGGPVQHIVNSYTVSHNIFYEKPDVEGACGDISGYTGTQTRRLIRTVDGVQTHNYDGQFRDQFHYGGGSEQFFYHGFDPPIHLFSALEWSVWQSRHPITSIPVAVGLWNFMFDSVERAPGQFNSEQAFAYQIDAKASVASLNGKFLEKCVGNKSNTSGGKTYSVVWSATQSCTGGSAHAEYHESLLAGESEDIVVDFSWTYTLRECIPAGSGGFL